MSVVKVKTHDLRDNVNFRWNQLRDWMELDYSLGPDLKWLPVLKSLDFYSILNHCNEK